MSNLKNLFDSIDKIEEQTKNLEINIDNIGKISEIKKSIEKGVKDISEINKSFETTKGDISGNLDKISKAVNTIKTDSIQGFKNIVDANGTLTKDFQEYTNTKLDNSNTKIQGYVREEINVLNDKIKLDLSGRFDQQKRDTSDSFKEIQKQIKEDNKEMKDILLVLEKKINLNKILVILNFCFLTIFSALILYKLFI